MKLAAIFLSVALAVFGIIFCWQYRQIQAEFHAERAIKSKLATESAVLQDRLSGEQARSATLEGERNARETVFAQLSNSLENTQTELEQTRQELQGARREAKAVREQAGLQAARIAQLEADRADLSQEISQFSSSLELLTRQIEETKQKLARAQGEREFLLAELKRLQSEKEEVQRQFNDVHALRLQLTRLREEAVLHRRYSWAQRGLYAPHERKGAELLVLKSLRPPPPQSEPRLEVDFHQDGGAEIVPGSSDPAGAKP